MKTPLLVLALVCAFAATAFAGKVNPHSPMQEARDHLEHAHSMVTKKEEGGKKVAIPPILNALNNAETKLGLAKNKKKGTAVNTAEKFIAEAKAELEAAKGGGSAEEHLQKAEKAIEEALKRVIDGIRQ